MTETKQKRLTFSQAVIEKLTAVIEALCNEHPELRSVAVALDWHENLNDSAPPGLWHDAQGPVRIGDIEVLFGSQSQLAKMQQLQMEVGMQTIAALQATITNKQKELEQLVERLRGEKTIAQPGDTEED